MNDILGALEGIHLKLLNTGDLLDIVYDNLFDNSKYFEQDSRGMLYSSPMAIAFENVRDCASVIDELLANEYKNKKANQREANP